MESAEKFEIYSKAIKGIDGMVYVLQQEALSLNIDASDLSYYERIASELKAAILQHPPDVSNIHRLIGVLTFLGNNETPMQVEGNQLYLAGCMGPYIPQLLHFLLLYLKEEIGYGSPSES